MPEDHAEVAEVSTAAMRQFVGYEMKRAFGVIRADVRRTLEPLDLRPLTFTALNLIVENPGLKQSQLADAMEVERPNVVVLLDELEMRDLISRGQAPNDRRAYALRATEAGRRLCGQAVAAMQAHEARMFDGLDAATHQAVRQALHSILAKAQSD